MARPQKIDDQLLHQKLTDVFREVGYEAASLARLSAATGLERASLYHRFPGGKQDMAREVLRGAAAWLGEHVLGPLAAEGPPENRIRGMIRAFDDFYAGGRRACLLNVLSAPGAEPGLADQIEEMFETLIVALAAVLIEAGTDQATARRRAERAVAGLQGSLVLARGLRTPAPFRNFLDNLEHDLLLG